MSNLDTILATFDSKELVFKYLIAERLSNALSCDEVDDIMQDIRVLIITKWEQCNNPSNAFSWLYSIVTNCVNDFYRRRQRRIALQPFRDDDVYMAPSTVEQDIYRKELCKKLLSCITKSRQATIIDWMQGNLDSPIPYVKRARVNRCLCLIRQRAKIRGVKSL